MEQAHRVRGVPPGLRWMLLLFGLILAAGGLLALTAAGDPGAALAEARQSWLSLMVGLLAGVVLLAFLLVVRIARRPADSAPLPPPPAGDDPGAAAV